MENEPTSQPLLQTNFNEAFSDISPDGRWIAYVSDDTGRDEIYVRPFPNTGDNKIPISRDGGDEPLWSPDGRELFFLNQANDGRIEVLSVTVTGEPTFSAGEPKVLFTGEYDYGFADPHWDISSDGQQFLMMKQVGQPERQFEDTQLVVVENWFKELNRLAPPSP